MELQWHSSSYSGQSGQCVQAAIIPGGGRAIRDSKDPDGPVLEFTHSEWAAFIKGAQAGEFGTF